MLRCLHVILLLLVASIVLPAQQSKVSMEEFHGFHIEKVVLPGGPKGNAVFSIVQGPNGFLWFGTDNGLYRYDGHEFLNYAMQPGSVSENSDPSVGTLYWDKRDRLWVSTYNGRGLFRFDPQTEEFKQFILNPPGNDDPEIKLQMNLLVSLEEDAEGYLWIGTEGGLIRFDQDTEDIKYYLTQEEPGDTLSFQNVTNIYLDNQGTLWVSTGYVYHNPVNGRLNRYDSETDRFTSFQSNPKDTTSLWSNLVKTLLEDSRGNFWVATANGLQKMDRKTGHFTRMHPDINQPYAPSGTGRKTPTTFTLLEDQNGGIWVGTISFEGDQPQLLYFDPKTSVSKTVPITSAAWALCGSKDGTIWVGGGHDSDKVYKITPTTENYDLQEGQFVFEDFKKTAIYQALGNAHPKDQWWGPLTLKFAPDGEMWLKYVYQPFINGAFVPYAILAKYNEQTSDIVFYHLEELDLTGLTSVVQFANFDNNWLAEGFAFDKMGNIWGSYPTLNVGLFRFDPKTGKTTQYFHEPGNPNSLASNYLTMVAGDSRGEIWVSYYQNGLSRFNPTLNKWTHYKEGGSKKNKIGGNLPTSFMESQDGRIWVGGEKSNNRPFISVIDPEQNNVEDLALTNSYNGIINNLVESEAYLAFTAQSTGLISIPVGQPYELFEVFNSGTNGFPINQVGSIIFDQEGILWASSFQNPIIARVDLKQKTWKTFRFNSEQPIQARKKAISPLGPIYFPVINDGWVKIDPKMFQPLKEDSSKLALVDLFIQGERQIPGRSKQLPKPFSELDRLTIAQTSLPFGVRFSAFQFQSANQIYQYRLYPFEEEWKFLHDDPILTYSYVPTGNYKLQVKAYHENGISKGTIELPVYIVPPWWQSSWAYLLYLLAFSLLITAFYLYQRRRWQLQTTLQLEQERASQLKELDQFKSRFYTNITHEFRTPLTVIKGISTQIDGQENIKSLIQRNSDRLLNLVNQLLDLSKLETKSLKIDWVQGDVIPYLQYLTESCHSLAGSKNINLAFFAKEDQLIMDFDENKLQQILINLLSNAIKFTPEYGSVKVIAAPIIEKGAPWLELTVKDTGKGIPQEKLVNIFNRFYQIDDSATRSGEGSGIGLALVKELVQLLGGRIEVASEVGKGSSFVVSLPVYQEAQQEADTDQSVRPLPLIDNTERVDSVFHSPVETNGEKPLILIIEDNADVTEYIISCLASGYHLQTASNGKNGIEKALEIVPDVILSDVMMPEMDGFEVCQHLKKDRRTSHIPIILLTAKATQEDKVAGLSHGADAYLTKPFDKEELLVRLNNLTALSQRLRERLSASIPDAGADKGVESQEAAFLKEINAIIELKLGDELFDTNHLCRAIAMSRTQLHRKLKALTGQSTASYIRTIRLKKAESLLKSTDLPIGEIALQVGYKDFSHFSRSFLKEFGLQPSETRK